MQCMSHSVEMRIKLPLLSNLRPVPYVGDSNHLLLRTKPYNGHDQKFIVLQF